MGFTAGTSSANNLPLRFVFIYGGSDQGWGQPYKINNLVNSGESVDGDYRISDLDAYFVDPYGSFFTRDFGGGTGGLGSTLQVLAYLGGTLGEVQSGITTSLLPVGLAGAQLATIHTGRVYGVSYSDRILRVRSKCRMANITNLRWQFPVYSFAYDYEIYGSYAFRSGNIGTDFYGPPAFYDYENNNTKWKAYAYVMATSYGPNGYLHVNGYPPMVGRGTGTLPIVGDDVYYYYAGTNSGGTNFYSEREPIKLDGTYFGTYFGTINTHEEALSFGFPGMDDAEAAKVGSFYPIEKTRWRSQSNFTGSYIHPICPIQIDGNPKTQFQHMIYGGMVTPLFTSSDVDASALAETATNTAYFYMKRRVWFNEKNVLDSLKDLFDTTQALFYVNTGNKFEFRTYGPKNLDQAIGTLGTNDLVKTSFDNYEEDFYNRFVLKFKYDSQNDEFGSTHETKSPFWSYDVDRPLIIESKFIQNPNEASVVIGRLLGRYIRTFPHIGFTTNLNKIGLDIGTIFQITDPNSGLNSKIIQVVGYNKNWSGKIIDFECFDAETLFLRKGYAYWEGDNSLTNAVSGTSTSGWGTNGTVSNINPTIYGTQFSWW